MLLIIYLLYLKERGLWTCLSFRCKLMQNKLRAPLLSDGSEQSVCYLSETAGRSRPCSGRCGCPPWSPACWGSGGVSWRPSRLQVSSPASPRGRTEPRTPQLPGYSPPCGPPVLSTAASSSSCVRLSVRSGSDRLCVSVWNTPHLQAHLSDHIWTSCYRIMSVYVTVLRNSVFFSPCSGKQHCNLFTRLLSDVFQSGMFPSGVFPSDVFPSGCVPLRCVSFRVCSPQVCFSCLLFQMTHYSSADHKNRAVTVMTRFGEEAHFQPAVAPRGPISNVM